MGAVREERRWVWAKSASILLSIFTIAFPYIFPSIFPEGTMPYYIITMPLGIVAGIFAYRIRSWWLIVLAIIAGLSPLLFAWILWFGINLIDLITDVPLSS